MNDLDDRSTLPHFERRLLDELIPLAGSDTDGGAGSDTGTFVPGRRIAALRRHPALVAAAAAIVLALALPAIAPFGMFGGPSPAGAALMDLARVAGSRPDELPGPGEYAFTRSEELASNTYVLEDGSTFTYVTTTTRRQWIGADGSGRIVELVTDVAFASPEDEAAWRAAGEPEIDSVGGVDETFEGGLYVEDLASLPTDADALRPRVEQLAEEQNQTPLETIATLLRGTSAPASLRSALFTVAAELPDVHLVGEVTDPRGRTGIAIEGAEEQRRFRYVFDRSDAALLWEVSGSLEDIDTSGFAPGDVFAAVGPGTFSAVYVRSAVVGSTGPEGFAGVTERTHCSAPDQGSVLTCEPR